jgi:hypothetical protein
MPRRLQEKKPEKADKIRKPKQIPSEQTVFAVKAHKGKTRNISCH